MLLASKRTASKIDTYYRHDDFGNITHIFEHGADLEQGDERTTTIAYNPAVEPYIVGLPWEVTISAGVPPAVQPANRITYYCYDGDNGSDFANCSGKPTKGLLTATQLVDDEGFYVTTTYAHDAYGNLTAVQTCSIIMDGSSFMTQPIMSTRLQPVMRCSSVRNGPGIL